MAEGHREAAHSVLDGGEHNATLGASGIARLIGSGPLENGHAVLRLIEPVVSFTPAWRQTAVRSDSCGQLGALG